ncbi:hypothetical protein IWQ60_005924 [Tieghemiomyces parasiticus]|uniref:Uncharacterized protein n=1 Tax=Tieghemiomyces parasiticus TaxID=78921 RepID=A0A9W8ABF0_9FUNG|nr:hypothetical protein IWQ60_005924 [Tieghemiomyces parasiticus]
MRIVNDDNYADSPETIFALAILEHFTQGTVSNNGLEDLLSTLQANRTMETARVSRQIRRRGLRPPGSTVEVNSSINANPSDPASEGPQGSPAARPTGLGYPLVTSFPSLERPYDRPPTRVTTTASSLVPSALTRSLLPSRAARATWGSENPASGEPMGVDDDDGDEADDMHRPNSRWDGPDLPQEDSPDPYLMLTHESTTDDQTELDPRQNVYAMFAAAADADVEAAANSWRRNRRPLPPPHLLSPTQFERPGRTSRRPGNPAATTEVPDDPARRPRRSTEPVGPSWVPSRAELSGLVRSVMFRHQPITNYPKITRFYPLRFNIDECDGGAAPDSPVEHILHHDSSCYSSQKRRNVGIRLSFNHRSTGDYTATTFTPARIVVQSPAISYNAPCLACMVFISTQRVHMRELNRYDGFSVRKWEQVMAKFTKDPHSWLNSDLIPLGVIRPEEEGDYRDTLDLHQVYSGRYLYLKLIESYDNTENIDLQSVQVWGVAEPQGSSQAELC